jgi:hypothetical protein
MRNVRSTLLALVGTVVLSACSDTLPTTGDGTTGTATLAVTPDSAVFAAAAVGSTSTATSFTVTNTGDAASGAVTAEFVGSHAGDFQATGGCLGSSLAPAATCSVNVTFSPQAGGNRVASLSIAASPGGTIATALHGSATTGSATLTLTAATADFAATALGATSAAMSFTVANTGTIASGPLAAALTGANASDFLGTAACLGSPLAPAATCAVAVTFSPQGTGNRTASLSVSGAPGGTVATALKGSGTTVAAGTATLTLSPATSDFAQVALTTVSAPVTFTVTNTGTAPSGALAASFTGTNAADFVATGSCLGSPLAAAATCAVAVTFAPGAIGSRLASLSVAGAPGGTVAAALTGTGITPPLLTLTPTSTNFGLANVSTTSAPVTFTVTNTGTAATGNLSATLSGVNASNFTTSAACLGSPLAPGATCAVGVTFTPNASGARLASLAFSATPGGTTVSASLTGTGVTPPTLTLTPASNAFAQQTVGTTSASVPFTVTNTGTVSSGAIAAAVTGPNAAEFVATSTCLGSPLAPSATCIVNVTFAPAADGSRLATLTVTGAPGGTVSSALTGTGASLAHLTIASAAAGLFSITNTGGLPSGTISLTSAANAGQSGTLTTNGDTCTGQAIAAGATCSLNLGVNPLAGGIVVMNFTVTASPGGSVFGSVASLATAPKFSGSVSTFSFPSTPVRITAPNSTPLSLTVTNTGGTTSGTIAVVLSGANASEFVSGGTCAGSTLAPAATCTVTLQFLPIPSGFIGTGRVATVTLNTSPGILSQLTLPVTGDTFSSFFVSLGSNDYGTFSVGVGTPQVFTIMNLAGVGATGPISITLGGPNVTDFQMGANTCTGASLVGGATCTVAITFTPGATGARSAFMSFSSTLDPGGALPIRGIGATPPSLSPSVPIINFGIRTTGTSSAGTVVTLTNVGGSSSGTFTGSISGQNANEFSLNMGTCSGADLATMGTCTVSVIFSPLVTGIKSATLTFGTGSAQVTLTGAGN